MFFCDKCRYLFNVAKNDRFDSTNKKEKDQVKKAVPKNNDKKTEKYQDNEPKNQETDFGSTTAYFFCKNCKNYKPIKPGTLIYSKNYNATNSVEMEDYTFSIYDQSLARTRNYICRNKNCATHKDDTNKEAVLTKNKSEQIVYICTVCSTNWINSI